MAKDRRAVEAMAGGPTVRGATRARVSSLREKRAKIIAAEGEALAAGELGRASDVMMAHPLALQLRNLQTVDHKPAELPASPSYRSSNWRGPRGPET